MSDPLEGLRKTVARISVNPASIKDAILETCPIIVADLETGEIYYATGVAERMFRYLIRGELNGINIDALAQDDSQADSPTNWRSVYANDQRMQPVGKDRCLVGKCKDGSTFSIVLGLHAAVIEDKRCVIVTVMDVT